MNATEAGAREVLRLMVLEIQSTAELDELVGKYISGETWARAVALISTPSGTPGGISGDAEAEYLKLRQAAVVAVSIVGPRRFNTWNGTSAESVITALDNFVLPFLRAGVPAPPTLEYCGFDGCNLDRGHSGPHFDGIEGTRRLGEIAEAQMGKSPPSWELSPAPPTAPGPPNAVVRPAVAEGSPPPASPRGHYFPPSDPEPRRCVRCGAAPFDSEHCPWYEKPEGRAPAVEPDPAPRMVLESEWMHGTEIICDQCSMAWSGPIAGGKAAFLTCPACLRSALEASTAENAMLRARIVELEKELQQRNWDFEDQP